MRPLPLPDVGNPPLTSPARLLAWQGWRQRDVLAKSLVAGVVAMLASAALCGLSCVVFAQVLRDSRPPLFAPMGLFYLGTRIAVGLALPLLFAAMAASSLRFGNTRSATGILYASTVLVLIGTAVSISLQDSYGVPL